ncbi:MAG: transglutaminase domain-containing protein, partial [Ignavibacteria bacterium]|nr:transglutaminase domain-containing protein [Ignavibacteria bacterium]
KMKILIFMSFLLSGSVMLAQTNYPEINKEIETGNFSKASIMLDEIMEKNNLTQTEKYELNFQKERLNRIRQDFRKTSEDILEYVRKYYPEADEKALEKWEEDGSLEYKIIDGKKFYFNRAHANLFRVNKEAKKQKEKIDGAALSELNKYLSTYIPDAVKESKALKNTLVKKVTHKLNYTVTVGPNAVPDGEIIRCWLPFPREGHNRQTNIKLISVNSDEYVIADNDNPQRTIYLEKTVHKDQPTTFNMVLEVTNYAELFNPVPEKIQPYNKESEEYKVYTSERKPHIVFTEELKNLSKKIIGEEKDPYLKAKKIFEWISKNVPWAGAREYSTIENISAYCVEKGYGDCGIKSLLFITFCRYNGIPAKWQSGWMLHPGSLNLHDWTEIYFEGYGWVPVDPDYGMQSATADENEDEKYFFFGGIDAHHLIINDDYSSPLFPAKIFPRSETVDFQRGELEWRGGNLYFDKWDYNMQVEYE